MSQPPQTKSSLLAIVELLIQDIKDPKTLQLRAGTMLLAILSYWVVTYQTEILEGFKNLSATTVIKKQADMRAENFPQEARQEAISILSQLGQDSVIIWEYEPQYLNNYVVVRASEGQLPIQTEKLDKYSVDKSSTMYVSHLQDKSVIGSLDINSESWGGYPLPTPVKLFIEQGQGFYYQAPIYDLSSVYAGVVLVLWKKTPAIAQTSDAQKAIAYFDSRIAASRRALERQK